jgi:hypothetical protein
MADSAAALGVRPGSAAAGAAIARAAFIATTMAAAAPLALAAFPYQLGAAGVPTRRRDESAFWRLQAGLLGSAACAGAAAARPALQAFLDASLLTWHELSHAGRGGAAACLPGARAGRGGPASSAAQPLLRALCETKFEQTNKLLCKVALQLLALPALQLAAALLLTAKRPGAGVAAGEAGAPALPAELWRAMALFLAAWSGGSWLAAAGAMLTGLRTGLFKL